MRKVPDDIKQQIHSLELHSAIEKYIPGGLKKRGGAYHGLCPFHDEKTPSFTVRPTFYKCFGCGKGGDIIRFFMDKESLSFVDAVQTICEENNIDYKPEEENAEPTLKDKILHACFLANKEFKSAVKYPEAVEYLATRSITQEAIDMFDIGYADNQFQGLTAKLKRYSVEEETLLECGLSKKNDEGVVYDKNRSRIVFPIHSYLGKVIGFSARAILPNQKPKYINSDNSVAFDKSRELYGLHLAKSHIKEADLAYVVEGATDVISMHMAGIKNTVGTLGTALTEHHCRLLTPRSKNVCIVYDGDSAGLRAIFKACEILLAQGMMVYISMLPEGHDPDSFCLEHKENAKDLINKAKRFIIDFRMDLLKQSMDAEDPVVKVRLAQELRRLINLSPDPVTRAVLEKEYKHKFFGVKPAPAPPVQPKKAPECADYHQNLLRCMILYRNEIDVYQYMDQEYAEFLLPSFTCSDHEIFKLLISNRNLTLTEILHSDEVYAPHINDIVNKGGRTNITPEDDLQLSFLYVEEVAWKAFSKRAVMGDIDSSYDPNAVHQSCIEELKKIEKQKQDLIRKINTHSK